MAQRRMFSLQIVDSDAFLDMPASTQLLYFHLSMRADDDGFIGNHKKIMRMVGASDDDIKVLLAKRFVLTFDSGVIVIKHWKIHNYIQNDRYHESQYSDEKNGLIVKDNGAYTERIHNVSKMDSQVRLELGKDRLGKVDIGQNIPFEEFWKIYPEKVKRKDAEKKWNLLSFESRKKIIEDVPKRIETKSWKEGFVPHPTTYLNQERWNDEIKKEITKINSVTI